MIIGRLEQRENHHETRNRRDGFRCAQPILRAEMSSVLTPGVDLIKRPPSIGNNVAAPPSRWSNAIPVGDKNRRQYRGVIKLRLAHSERGSYVIPDMLIGVGGHRYFLPSFFSPPIIAFNVEPGKHIARLSVDVGSPRAEDLTRLLVKIRSEDRIRAYEDGAQLYACTLEGPRSIASLATGICVATPDGDYKLKVYHHTTPTNAANIRGSRELWSSSWNLAGTQKLKNVAYGYFTSLPQVRDEEDLRRIAMASDGTIKFQTTSERGLEDVLSLQVYRGDTRDRTSSMEFEVSCAIVAPPHLLFHGPVHGSPAYYEVIAPEIIRVGVNPSAKLRIAGSDISIAAVDAKRFSYVVVGDAETVEGLAAPYNEEETKRVAHLQELHETTDLFRFWQTNANTDQVTGRSFEPRKLESK